MTISGVAPISKYLLALWGLLFKYTALRGRLRLRQLRQDFPVYQPRGTLIMLQTNSKSPPGGMCWDFSCLDEKEQGVLMPYLNMFRPAPTIAEGIEADGNPLRIPLTHAAAFLDFLHEKTVAQGFYDLAMKAFRIHLLGNDEIHSVATRAPADARYSLLKAYFGMRHPEREGWAVSSLFQASASDSASLLALFGGQGTHNSQGLDDLRKIYDAYRPLLGDLVDSVAQVLQKASRAAGYGDGDSGRYLDLKSWLHEVGTTPSRTRLSSAPVSFPMNGILSLCHYCIACKVLQVTPGTMRRFFSGATGHSQGIIIAAVVASSDTWERFEALAGDAVELLFWIGLQSHNAALASAPPAARAVPGHRVDGVVSCLLSVRGLAYASVENVLHQANIHLPPSEQVSVALVNSSDSVVVAGPPAALVGVYKLFENLRAKPGQDQNLVFLPVSAPFHSPLLRGVAEKVLEAVGERLFADATFGIPVIHPRSGVPIVYSSTNELVSSLISMITSEPGDWTKAGIQAGVTHLVDFGPGRASYMLQGHVQGSGTRVILASEMVESTSFSGGKHELFTRHPITPPADWSQIYAPKIVNEESSGPRLSTRLSRLLGTPPVIVAGMTPTTVPWDFVATVVNAGYHIELAGGGYAREGDLEEAIRRLAVAIPPHRGIAINIIYANPQAVAWQTELIRRLVAEGLPIHGMTIGAGVPSLDTAVEYVQTLGLKYIGLKPGSAAAIERALEIADTCPRFPFMLQWTGGRAGGHHSYEDQYEPILQAYASIRARPNVVLVVGGGFGDAQSISPFLTGEWSEVFHRPRMPFDGVLLGSRLMVAREAHTSTGVKELIRATPGTAEANWHATYAGASGGVITVRSEMGEPIHQLANRAARFWRELDDSVFSISDAKSRLAELQRRRAEIIYRLNQDYSKPWFAMDATGEAVDLEDLTYYECLARLVELQFVSTSGEWLARSYKGFFREFLTRVVERLPPPTEGEAEARGNVDSSPGEILAGLRRRCPEELDDYLYPEDVSLFLTLCRRPGEKPVNFIPRLDEHFETYFKKDSLWQADRLEAVIDQDPERVCIIHGPVAANYSNSTTESAVDILGSITTVLVEMLQESSVVVIERHDSSGRRLASSPAENFQTQKHTSSANSKDMNRQDRSGTILLSSDDRRWPEWLRCCLKDEEMVLGRRRVPNPIPRACAPGPRDTVDITENPTDGSVTLTLQRFDLKSNTSYPAISLASTNGKHIDVTLNGSRGLCQTMSSLRLDLEIFGAEEGGVQTLVDVTRDRDARIRFFYAACWGVGDIPRGISPSSSLLDIDYTGTGLELTPRLAQEFVAAIAPELESHETFSQIPLDIAMVLGWDALVKPLCNPQIGGNLQRLLHRANTIEVGPAGYNIAIGDLFKATSRVISIKNQRRGKTVEVYSRSALIATVAFSAETCFGNPVVDFLRRHGSVAEPRVTLEQPGWFSSECPIITIPNRSWEYSVASRDTNPIHTCPSFAAFAGLQQPILHGMYTSAVCRLAVQDHVAAMCGGAQFRQWRTSFEGMLRGGEQLRIEIRHTSMTSGRMVLEVQAHDVQSGAKIIRAEAEIEQTGTAYLFCGQGSQRQGMGMATYESDPAARDVWDRGDRTLFELYGFSLLDIVRRNPKALTVYFGGHRGRQLRTNYLALTKSVVQNGEEVAVSVFDGLTESSSSYTFQNPDGLLFATQMAQPAISLLNLAEMAALRSRGLILDKALFAGHSLGEYSALAGCASILTVETLMRLSFYRGMVMQTAVEQDQDGRTDYSMVAVNPSRVHPEFGERQLQETVAAINSDTGLLLEVVNLNVEGQQYVCAGHLEPLWILAHVCDQLASSGTRGPLVSNASLGGLIAASRAALSRAPKPLVLKRGKATVPLSGVNVPFHSSYLRGGIDPYRITLMKEIRVEDVDPDRLVGRYIPNLTGKPFFLDRTYVEEVAHMTGSLPLKKFLEQTT
ncbi:hypothetical protein GQ53DRAFT_806166 [Thozetella sp. PMI_491]|nr:hypothetical protein GQ53DRAFT_806166 [Thozetella sp. PMI_491]